MKDKVQDDAAPAELTPEQAIASQLEGFTEAVNSTPVIGKTEDAKPAQSAEEIAKAAQEQAAKDAAEAAAKTAAEERQKVLDSLSAKDITELVEKSKQFDTLRNSLDKVAGKFGSVEQQIAKLSEAKVATTAQLTEEDVADLEKEYGPELAKALLKVLNKFGQKIATPAKADDKAAPEPKKTVEDVLAAVTKSVDEKLVATTRAVELKMLKREHPDWMQLVQVYDKDGKYQGFNPEFVAWVSTLPADEQDRLYNGWDLEFNATKIGDYKTYRKAQEDAAKAAAAKEKSDKAQVAGRLKAGVIPKGIPSEATQKSALDEQREGYLAAM